MLPKTCHMHTSLEELFPLHPSGTLLLLLLFFSGWGPRDGGPAFPVRGTFPGGGRRRAGIWQTYDSRPLHHSSHIPGACSLPVHLTCLQFSASASLPPELDLLPGLLLFTTIGFSSLPFSPRSTGQTYENPTTMRAHLAIKAFVSGSASGTSAADKARRQRSLSSLFTISFLTVRRLSAFLSLSPETHSALPYAN